MDKQADNNAEIIASESNQAILYREQKKYSKAYKCIEKVIKLGRSDGWVYSEAGLYYESIKDYKKALTYLDKLNDDYDDKYTLYLTLGICNEKSGKYDIASDYYQKAKAVNDCLEIRKQISTLKKKKIFFYILEILFLLFIIKLLLNWILGD